MRNHQVFDDSIDTEKLTLDEDEPATGDGWIAFSINKTSREAKSVLE